MAREKYPVSWQIVTNDNNLETRRLEVPGGFLVTVREREAGRLQTLSTTFVAVPDGNWELTT